MDSRHRQWPWIAVAAVAVLGSGGTAAAARLITGKQIKDGSITVRDLARSARPVPAADGEQGPVGPAGPAGPPGPAGPVATARATPVTASRTAYAGQVTSVVAACPAGQSAVADSWFSSIAHAGAAGLDDARSAAYLIVVNDTSIDVDIDVTAFCAPTGTAVAASRRARDLRRTRRDVDALAARLRAAAAQ